MRIGHTEVGAHCEPFIIAEVAQSHEGSLGQAMAFIDVAAECGASAVKFQTHIASEESTKKEPWRIKFSQQDESRYDYWERMSLPKKWWGLLKKRADEKGLIFLSSPFSVQAVDWLEDVEIAAWKIASGEVDNEELLSRIEQSEKPVLISTGLSNAARIKEVVKRFSEKNTEVILLHCTSMYPTAAEEVGLNILTSFKNEFGSELVYGLSDHSGTIVPAIVSAYLGASVFELHLTLHKKMFGPDVSSSLDPVEFKEMVNSVRFATRMRVSDVEKSNQLDQIAEVKTIFSRSLVANRDLSVNHFLAEGDIGYKKPGGGLSYDKRSSIMGKRLVRGIKRDEKITLPDIEFE